MSSQKIISLIKKNKVFLISTHVNPDPDALCSELALAEYLKVLGKKVFIVNEDTVPQRLSFLPGTKKIQKYKKNKIVPYDIAIIVDCGDLDRIGKVKDCLKGNKPIVNIDHHITNDMFGHVNLLKPKASSTGEVLYEFFKEAKFKLNRNVALCLYAGIMTDTGSFRYENTTAHTHAIVADLMRFDFSANDLYQKLYDIIPLDDLKAFTQVITHFEALFGGRVVLVELNKKVLAKFSEAFDLRDAIFKFLRSIQGVEVIAIFTEVARNKTRINLRSTNKVDVAKLANIFGGGGHKRASGCMIGGNIYKARQDFLKQLKKDL